jgi:hypothetical protein
MLGSDLDEQLIVLGIEYVKGIFLMPRIQGDPHPGNVKLLENNKVGLIDFGIFAPAPKDKASFFALIQEYGNIYNGNLDIEELFGKFLRVFAGNLYNAFRRLHDVQSNDSSEDLTRTMGKLAKKAFTTYSTKSDTTKLTSDPNLVKMINQIVNKQNRFGLILTLESTEILRTAQTYVSLVETLNRQEQVLSIVFSEGTRQLSESNPELTVEEPTDMTVARAINIVTKWLERVANRDPVLFRQLMSHIRGRNTALPEDQNNKLKETLHV